MIGLNSDVILKTFLGTEDSRKPINQNENYWKLIGQQGQVLELGEKRVPVKFNCDIDAFGLENHNPIKNSLWILPSDLDKIKTKPNNTYNL